MGSTPSRTVTVESIVIESNSATPSRLSRRNSSVPGLLNLNQAGPEEELPPLQADFHAKLRSLDATFEKLAGEEDAGSQELTEVLEEVDYLSSLPPSATALRAQWVRRTEELGLVREIGRLWPVFWADEGFLVTDNAALANLSLNFSLCLRILWSSSQLCAKVGEGVTASGLLSSMSARVASPIFDPAAAPFSTIKVRYVLSAFLSIILNTLRHNFGPSNLMLRSNRSYLERLVELAKVDAELVRLKAFMAYAYSANESELLVLQPSKGTEKTVSTVVSMVDESLEKGESKGFTASELLNFLIRIAVYDSYKKLIVQMGGMEVIQKAMGKSGLEEEIVEATKVLWQVAFLEQNRKRIKKDSKILHTLHSLEGHREAGVREVAQGALWTVTRAIVKFRKASRTPDQSEETTRKLSQLCTLAWKKHMNRGHVMISYSWDYKHIVVPLNAALRNAGYNTWLDLDRVSGSVLEAMAEGVEAASVILVCLSDAYKNSPSCRTEAEYLFRLKKSFIPIRMQADFVADGWLGALVGNQLYFNCTSVAQTREVLPRILKEINTKLSHRDEDSDDEAPPPRRPKDALLYKWSKDQVREWLMGCVGLPEKVVGKDFGDWDGKQLCALHRLHDRAPGSFFSLLADKTSLSLAQTLAFSAALDAAATST